MVGRQNDGRVAGTNIRYLIVLMCLAIGGILFLQINWLRNSYRVSKQQTGTEMQLALDDAIRQYQVLKADTVRRLIRQMIRSDKDYNTAFWEGPNARIGYRHQNMAYVTYAVPANEVNAVKRDTYTFLLHKIDSLPLAPLSAIYTALIGVRTYPAGSRDEAVADSLMMRLNHVYTDEHTLAAVLKRGFAAKGMPPGLRVKYLATIGEISTRRPDPKIPITQSGGTGGLTEVVINPVFTKLTITERLGMINRLVAKMNESGDNVYVLKVLFDDREDYLMDKLPAILVAVPVPVNYTLRKMALSVAGSGLLLLFVGSCLSYFVYIIARQKRLSEMKNDFIRNMSHELKTPIATSLAAVQGLQYFDVLKDEAKTRSYLETAAGEIQRLALMTDKILLASVFERAGFTLEPVSFNLHELLEEIVRKQQLSAGKQVDFTLTYTAAKSIVADRTHIDQVISNLVENAIKYSGDPATVRITCRDAAKGAEISIEDNGPGIPPMYQHKIFGQFFRVPSPNDHRVKGYGLGLSYVRSILQKHGGSIILANSGPSGSKFVVYLPH